MSLDGGHWYLPDGTPYYEVAAKDGHMRPVTLRDARKVKASPSVTTVLRVVAKEQLVAWKVRQGILAALTMPRVPGEPETGLLDRIEADGMAQAKQAAEEGSRIHAAVEALYRHEGVPERYMPHAYAVEAEIRRLFPDVTDWVPETRFAHPDGFGGMADLHSPSTGIVVDYKGTEGECWHDAKHAYKQVMEDGELKDKRCDWDQHWQLGAYQRGLRLPRAACANIFVSRTHPGKVASKVWTPAEVAGGEAIFMSALTLWQAIKDYRP